MRFLVTNSRGFNFLHGNKKSILIWVLTYLIGYILVPYVKDCLKIASRAFFQLEMDYTACKLPVVYTDGLCDRERSIYIYMVKLAATFQGICFHVVSVFR